MAIASVLLGWILCVVALETFGEPPAWYAWLLIPIVCLGGPLSVLFNELHEAPFVAMYVGIYGLGVGWFFWKPSIWSKAVFILLSVLWVFLGCAVVGTGL